MRLIPKGLTHLILLGVFACILNTTAQAEELPNPYKLDLREASEKEYKEAVAYGSTLGVTIVVYSAQEAPWKLSLDAANLLAAEGITVIVARRSDRNGNPQDAEIEFIAKGKGREQLLLSTKFKNMFYGVRKERGDHFKIKDTAQEIHEAFFNTP